MWLWPVVEVLTQKRAVNIRRRGTFEQHHHVLFEFLCLLLCMRFVVLTKVTGIEVCQFRDDNLICKLFIFQLTWIFWLVMFAFALHFVCV